MLGRNPEEAVGANVFALVPSDDLACVRRWFEDASSGRGVVRETVRFRFRHNDSWRWLESVAAHLPEHSQVRGIVIGSRDVTARMAVEERLALRARLLDAVGQAVIATDPQGRVIYWNKAAEVLYEEIPGL